MIRPLVTLLVAVAASPAAAGPCLVDGLAPQIMTPTGSTIDQHGGVVVAAVSSPMHREQRRDVSAEPWEFRKGKARSKTVIKRLAPGLALHSPDDKLASVGDKVALEDAKDHTAIEIVVGYMITDDMPMDEAPRVVSITQATTAPMLRSPSTVATLKAPPPAGTVALLVYDGAMDKPLARGFVLVEDPKATTIVIYSRHRCEAQIPGTVPTGAGDTVRLAWVDGEGHVSIPSERIKITKVR